MDNASSTQGGWERLASLLETRDYVMIVAVCLAAIETMAYFYGLSNLRTAAPSWTYLTAIHLLPLRQGYDLLFLFLWLFVVALTAVYWFRVQLNDVLVEKKEMKPPKLGDVAMDVFRDMSAGYFVDRFIVRSDFNWGSFGKDFLATILFPLATIVSYALKRLKFYYFSSRAFIFLFVWVACIVWFIHMYIGNDQVYEATRIGNYGYYKDAILLALIVLLIAYVPPIVRQLTSPATISLILGVVMVLAALAIFLDVRFPDTEEGHAYIKKIAAYNHAAPNDVMIDDVASISSWHGKSRDIILLLVGVVLPFAMESLKRIHFLGRQVTDGSPPARRRVMVTPAIWKRSQRRRR
ncbi:MAG: hypothetical protein JST22_04430 [Bacteroidetes bacterium]|nr:hypothetical protein [Bacteroidota bacterium]